MLHNSHFKGHIVSNQCTFCDANRFLQHAIRFGRGVRDKRNLVEYSQCKNGKLRRTYSTPHTTNGGIFPNVVLTFKSEPEAVENTPF